MFFSLWAASDHRAGTSDSGSLPLQRQRLQLLCLRGGEPGVPVQVSVRLFTAVTVDPRVPLQLFHQISTGVLWSQAEKIGAKRRKSIIIYLLIT